MRIERISNNQFEIFLTYDDLVERGFAKEQVWYDSDVVQNLFSDMMFEASDELNIELQGVLQIQVFLMQTHGMHVFVTQSSEREDETLDDFIEMKVTLQKRKQLSYEFEEFDDLIQCSYYLARKSLLSGSVFYQKNAYYLFFEESDLTHDDEESIVAILTEFAKPTLISDHYLKEYGTHIFDHNAVEMIQKYFH